MPAMHTHTHTQTMEVNVLRWERCHQMLKFISTLYLSLKHTHTHKKIIKRKSEADSLVTSTKYFYGMKKMSHARAIFIVYVQTDKTALQQLNSCIAPKPAWVFPLVIIYGCKVWHVNSSWLYSWSCSGKHRRGGEFKSSERIDILMHQSKTCVHVRL